MRVLKYPGHLCLELVELAPSSEWSPAFPDWCFLQIGEGQGYWLDKASVRELNSGDMVSLSPLRAGRFRASQLGCVRIHCFRFAPDLAIGLLTPLERDCFESLAIQPGRALRLFAAGHPAAKLFTQATRAAAGGNVLMERCELLRIVATAFSKELLQPELPEITVLTARQRIQLIMNKLPESEFLKLSSGELAMQCGCSRIHFNRSFYRVFGMSLRRKQQEFRLLKARQMLQETACHLEAVGTEAGYASVEEFNGAFQKRFGIAPAEWRNPKSGQGEGNPNTLKAVGN